MAIKVANNQSMTGITALPSGVSGGAWTLLSTQTASSSSSLSFTSGLDSTYDVYCFRFYNIHPEDNNVNFTVGFRDGSSAFDATKTTTVFFGNGVESDSGQQLAYSTGSDLAQSTGYQRITDTLGNDNDSSCSGELFLFSPSNTTFVKHFISRINLMWSNAGPIDWFVAGYCNTTTAIDGVDFKFASGDIDAGVVKLYGIS